MKIIHISDIHLTVPGESMGGLDPHARLARALADVTRNHGDAARIVITGDLAHWGERAAYEALQAVLEPIPLPVRLLIGNHDDRATFLSVFCDHPVDANGYVNHAETVAGTRFVYLDTVGTRTHAGHFGPDRQAWLEAELSAHPRLRLFMHHNPMQVGLPAEDQIALVAEDRPAFHALLARYGERIDYLHFGHVHAPISGRFQGVPFASVHSTGNQSLPDLREPYWLQGAAMAPAYNVILAEAGQTTIHQIPFAWDGPVSRAGPGWDDWLKPGSNPGSNPAATSGTAAE